MIINNFGGKSSILNYNYLGNETVIKVENDVTINNKFIYNLTLTNEFAPFINDNGLWEICGYEFYNGKLHERKRITPEYNRHLFSSLDCIVDIKFTNTNYDSAESFRLYKNNKDYKDYDRSVLANANDYENISYKWSWTSARAKNNETLQSITLNSGGDYISNCLDDIAITTHRGANTFNQIKLFDLKNNGALITNCSINITDIAYNIGSNSYAYEIRTKKWLSDSKLMLVVVATNINSSLLSNDNHLYKVINIIVDIDNKTYTTSDVFVQSTIYVSEVASVNTFIQDNILYLVNMINKTTTIKTYEISENGTLREVTLSNFKGTFNYFNETTRFHAVYYGNNNIEFGAYDATGLYDVVRLIKSNCLVVYGGSQTQVIYNNKRLSLPTDIITIDLAYIPTPCTIKANKNNKLLIKKML